MQSHQAQKYDKKLNQKENKRILKIKNLDICVLIKEIILFLQMTDDIN